MNERLPYYMAYPMPLQYDDERIERRDFEYMKSMYPMTVKRILPYVEAECDRMSYAGSVIYDEYPDQLQIHMMCNRVYEQVKDIESQDDTEMEMQQYRRDDRDDRDNRLRDLVQILIFQELFRRRNRHRRDRRRFY
ncbi:MAG: hypothetical protein IJZ53_07115 [Tyzzerella sp.]|nr:hypothetical protein [Tyzzerella sp.]